MALTAHSSIGPRNAHDLIVGWFYGGSILDAEGWTSAPMRFGKRSAGGLPPHLAARGRRPAGTDRCDPAWHCPGMHHRPGAIHGDLANVGELAASLRADAAVSSASDIRDRMCATMAA